MSWMSLLAVGIFLSIAVCGCWLMDRRGTGGVGASSESSADDGVASLGVIIATAVAVSDLSATDAANSDAPSSDM